MIQLRLKKISSNKQLIYYIVVTDKSTTPSSGFIEKIGSYNPHIDKWQNKYIFIDMERYTYWIEKGAVLNKRLYTLILQTLF